MPPRDLATVKRVVTDIKTRFGKSERVWVMDRGMIDEQSLAFLSEPGRRYLLATKRHALNELQSELASPGWQRLPDNPDFEVRLLQRDEVHYLLARSKPRRSKERAMRRRQRRGLAKALKKLYARVAVGRLKERFLKARPFVSITAAAKRGKLTYAWKVRVVFQIPILHASQVGVPSDDGRLCYSGAR